MTQTRAGSPAGLRVPAAEIEQLVANRIRQFLSEPDNIFKATEQQGWEAVDQQQLIDGGNRISSSWSTLSPIQIRTLLTTLICRIDLCRDRVDVHIRTERLATVLGRAPPVSGDPNLIITLSVPAQLRRAGKQITMRVERSDAFQAKPNASLIKLIVRAHLFEARLLQSRDGTCAELARRENLNRSYYSRAIRLAYLAPDITRAILDGRQPPGLSAARLVRYSSLPLAWPEQRMTLGFT